MSKGYILTEQFQVVGTEHDMNYNKPVIMLLQSNPKIINLYYPVIGIYKLKNSNQVFLTNTNDAVFSEDCYGNDIEGASAVNACMLYTDFARTTKITEVIKPDDDVKVRIYTFDSDGLPKYKEYNISNVQIHELSVCITIFNNTGKEDYNV